MAFVTENFESWFQSLVACIAQLCDHVKSEQNIVVVMNRGVESEPRQVFPSFLEELSFQIDFSSTRDRTLNLP